MLRKLILAFIGVVTLLSFSSHQSSCRSASPNKSTPVFEVQDTVRLVRSVAELRAVPHGVVIERCDLSGRKIPLDLKERLIDYHILHLNLSNCQLTSLDPRELPSSLLTLDVSHNKIQEYLSLGAKNVPNLQVLDCSYNAITCLLITRSAVRINASHNKLKSVVLIAKNGTDTRFPKYLDISYNWDFENACGFDVSKIDTLITEQAAHGQPLYQGYIEHLL